MSKKGENIYKRKDGRWEARYIRGYSPEGKTLYGYCYGKNYREAKEKKQLAIFRLPKKVTYSTAFFAHYCEEFMKQKEQHLKRSTISKYRGFLDGKILPALGNMRPPHIRTEDVQTFLTKMSAEGLSVKTLQDLMAFLRQLLGFACNMTGCDAPAFRVLLPKKTSKEPRVLSLDEQQRLVRYLNDSPNRCKAGILLALFTGLRIGEICALREEDVDMKEDVIRIRQTLQRTGSTDAEMAKDGEKTRVIFSSPKSAASERTIPLSQNAKELCRRWMTGNGQAFFLTGSAKKWMEPRLLQYWINKIAEECRLPDLHFHALRHTFATRCVEVGFEIKTLSEILGHSNPRVTLERYVHSSIQMKRLNMEKLSTLGM